MDVRAACPASPSPLEWGREQRDYYKTHFGPLIAVYAGLAGQPDRLAALARDLADLAARTNRAAPGEPARYDFEYLLVVGSRA